MRAQGHTLLKGKHRGHWLSTPNYSFYNLIFWTWSSIQSHGIDDLKLAIGQSHSAWQQLTQIWNAELKSRNVTHSGL